MMIQALIRIPKKNFKVIKENIIMFLTIVQEIRK